MRWLLIGGKNKMEYLSEVLQNRGQEVVLINKDREYCKKLAMKTKGTVLYGDGTKPHMFEEAGIENIDGVVALTPSDADNLAVCMLAKKKYAKQRVFSIVSNPKQVNLFRVEGLKSIVSSTFLIAKAIEQATMQDNLEGAIVMGEDSVVLIEWTAKDDSWAKDKLISKLGLTDFGIIGCIFRGYSMEIPRGDTKIQGNDRLLLICYPNKQQQMIQQLEGGGLT